MPAQAQKGDMVQLYREAEQAYMMGRIEQSMTLLEQHSAEFPRNLKQSVYRLLSLCNLALDQTSQAEHYASLLLADDPYYSAPMQDPQRFKDIIDSIKAGLSATITTASSQAENLNEVPVPVTLITEEMIQNSGARNLQELLAAYVPGMYIIDCNDDINIAMRGIYSNGQEKILFMLNGHRLNSYCSNTAAPDFSIALEKLKQIEVLRGPASSLYGGVALTAVVNLITKAGADIDGVKAKVGIGNYGQYHGDLIFGKRYFDLDILLWGSFHLAKGQKKYVDKSETGLRIVGGDVTVGGIGNKPSYDFGTSIKYKNLSFLYNTQYSQVQAPMTMTHTFSPYDIERYKTFYGIRPSHTTMTHHADLSYEQGFGNVYLKGRVTYDNSNLTHYQVISDLPLPGFMDLLPLPETSKALVKDSTGGFGRYISGQEHTFGAKVQGDWRYINNGTHKGLLSFGAEYSHFQLDDARYVFVYDFVKTLPETVNISELGKGHENSANVYVQLKHQWGPFILNAGLRYDHKARYEGSTIQEFSPRVALIFVQPKWNVKLSYAKAFIDAPYLYRKTNQFLLAFMGKKGRDQHEYGLDPEFMHSYQLTLAMTQLLPGLDMELNTFYNRTRNLIFMDIITHFNMGNSDIYGLELSGNYKYRNFSANLSASWLKNGNYELYYNTYDKAFNMPELSVKSTLAWKVTKQLNLHTHMAFSSKQLTCYEDIIMYGTYEKADKTIGALEAKQKAGEKLTAQEEQALQTAMTNYFQSLEHMLPIKDIPAYFLWDVGANYTIGKLELGLNVHNVLNKQYTLGGACTGGIPQKGRWWMATVAYKF